MDLSDMHSNRWTFFVVTWLFKFSPMFMNGSIDDQQICDVLLPSWGESQVSGWSFCWSFKKSMKFYKISQNFIKFHTKLLTFPACRHFHPNTRHRQLQTASSPIDVILIDIFPTSNTPQEVAHRLLLEINQESRRRAIAVRRKECLGVKETIEELAPVAGSSSLCAMTIKFFVFLFIFNSFRFSFIHWRCDRLVISLLIAFFLRSPLTAVKGTITTSVFEALIKRFFTIHSHCRERSKWRWKDWKDSPEDQLRMNCCLSCILRYRFRSDTQNEATWVRENFSPTIVAACWAHLRSGRFTGNTRAQRWP